MKKVLLLIFVVGLIYAYIQDRQVNDSFESTVEYVTSEGTSERVAEEIIRDVWGVANYWWHLDKSLPPGRVVSVKIIPQADKTSALDMRVRIDSPNTYAMTVINCLDSVCKLMPKLLSSENSAGLMNFACMVLCL